MSKGKKGFSQRRRIIPMAISLILFLASAGVFAAPVAVDVNGFDPQGRIVASFGSPVVDGMIDKLWNDAPRIIPRHSSSAEGTSAVFKALWDDKALYILAEVTDKEMSAESGNPYMQDSLEIFLDENNEKTKDYGVDDLHFRVNYENAQSADVGNIERFYSAARKTENGYVIEARIAFKYVPANDKVLGIDLQINDAIGAYRTGTVNVFDSTNGAWMDTGKFGEALLTGKTKSSKSGLNPYDLSAFIKIARKLDMTRYRNLAILTNAISESEQLLKKSKATQKQIDKQYAELKRIIGTMELTDAAANEKDFKTVPDEYRAENEKQGRIETLEYAAANLNDGTDAKRLNVYLPSGYDAADAGKKYNVLYLMHGGGENENTIFGGPGQNTELKRILDNMIARGDIAPLIVVTPSFNGGKNDTAAFHEELTGTIVPLIETKYRAYAASASAEDLKTSRNHRAFGGFSMGSVTTWYVYINSLDYFKYFLPISGDCWALGRTAGGAKSREIAEYLATVPKKAGYGVKDYYIFCATGDQDIAYPNLKPQIDAMKELPEAFVYSGDVKKGNFYFIVSDGGTHAWNWVNQYIYDILPDLFRD